mgnify:CR=1 FL=1
MFISRVPLNGARRTALEIMASPNKMHGAVEAAFAPVPDCDFLSACQSGQDFAEGEFSGESIAPSGEPRCLALRC